jgi:hypothetical protein
MRTDPQVNAARLRVGYGLTLHRAQGQRYPEIVANLDTGQGQANESYFRWLYTLFTLPEKRIYLSNIPRISPFVQARWDESQSRLDNVRQDDLIKFDPIGEETECSHSEFDFPARELEALYRHVALALSKSGFTVCGIEHHQYQEVYDLAEGEGAHCRLRLHYKKGFRISRIEVVDPSTPVLNERIREALISNITFDDEFQERIHEEVRGRLSPMGIEVRGVEHGSFKEIYFLECAEGRAKVEFHFTNEKFVTAVALSTYSDQRMKDKVREGLGL